MLTLLKNDEKGVGPSTHHRCLPMAFFAKHSHNTVNTKHASKSAKDVSFFVEHGSRTQDPWTL